MSESNTVSKSIQMSYSTLDKDINQRSVRFIIKDFLYTFNFINPDSEDKLKTFDTILNKKNVLLKTFIDQMSDEAIMEVNVPNGVPLVYELDDNLKPIQHYYLD